MDTPLQGTATPIATLERFAHAILYVLSEPLHDYDGKPHTTVVVSAAEVPFTGPETYIFPADERGEVLSWHELRGSYRGGLSHEVALAGAGYLIERTEETDGTLGPGL